MRNDYSVKLEVWTTRVHRNGERHLESRVAELETRHATYEDAKVQFAKLDLGQCWKRRDNDRLAALKSAWYRGSCIAFDSYDVDDLRREAALEELGELELDEIEIELGEPAMAQASGQTPSAIFQACS